MPPVTRRPSMAASSPGIDRVYAASLRWTLAHPMAVIWGSLAVFRLTFSAEPDGRPHLRAERGHGRFTVHVDTPQDLARRHDRNRQAIVEKLAGLGRGVAPVVSGRGGSLQPLPRVSSNLLPVDERKVSQDQVVAQVRKILSVYPGANPTVTPRNPLGGGGAGGSSIQANLLGADIGRLYDYSQQILAKAKQTPSLVDARTDYRQRQPGGARHRRSGAGGRPRGADGDGR